MQDFSTIWDLDVFFYFDLYDDYKTPLQKAVFKKTPEYGELLDSLRTLKRQILSGRWYVDMTASVWEVSSYDIEAKGMRLIHHLIWGYGEIAARSRKTCSEFFFPSLPTKRVDGYLPVFKDEYLFLPMSEETGLAIETHESNVRVYAVFSVIGQGEVRYNVLTRDGTVESSAKYLTTDNVRLIVGNVSTGEVYFSRTYRND
jgi:hypothetical protein